MTSSANPESAGGIEAAILQPELEFFARHRREWAAGHKGEFVLLGRQVFGGFYRSYDDALRAGIRAFGPVTPFLIRQI